MSLFKTLAACSVMLSVLAGSIVDVSADERLVGKYITIQTDLPPSDAITQLPQAFDAAVVQWAAYFGIDLAKLDSWHVTAYLMSRREAFEQRGVLPDFLPPFPHGYQFEDSVWVVKQPSDYYTRHLLLHEGVHALMWKQFGGSGAAWYMEGMAEYLGTHRWHDGKIETGIVPPSRESVPFWGRIKIIRTGSDQSKTLSLGAVLRYSQKAHQQVEPYAWSWASMLLLNMYPEYRSLAIQAAARGNLPPQAFTQAFLGDIKDQWPVAQMRWRMLIDDLDYGFDPIRNRIDIDTMQPWDATTHQFTVSADRGWQSTGLLVKQGTRLSLRASGRYQLGTQPRPWISEAQGVTIDYHRGNPLGMVLAAVVPSDDRDSRFTINPQIAPIGNAASFNAAHDGLLLLRIGDHPSRLADNSGSVQVTLTADEKN